MNNQSPQRRTIRLAEYDYGQEGLYFVTLRCQNKKSCFGRVENGEMILNEAGRITHDEWLNTPLIRKNIELGEFVIMPNHLHGIIIINRQVGANCIRPNKNNRTDVCNTSLQSPSQTLGSIIRGYKSAVMRKINQLYNIIPSSKSIWQRNYFEHIIRNEQSYQKITDYILQNPNNWIHDNYFNE